MNFSGRFVSLISIIIILLSSALACSYFTKVLPTGATPTLQAVPTQVLTAPQLLSIADFDQGLSPLNSYRASTSFKIVYQGVLSNQNSTQVELIHEVNQEQQAEDTQIMVSGTLPVELQGGSLAYYQLPGAFYLLHYPSGNTNPLCDIFGSGIFNLPMLPAISLGQVLGPLTEITLVKASETVGNMSTDHYAFTEVNLESQTGGYVLKSTGKATGSPALLGIDQPINLIWDYELQEVNQLGTITPPTGCQATATLTPKLDKNSGLVAADGYEDHRSPLGFIVQKGPCHDLDVGLQVTICLADALSDALAHAGHDRFAICG